jgi:RecA/RadA recombinase
MASKTQQRKQAKRDNEKAKAKVAEMVNAGKKPAVPKKKAADKKAQVTPSERINQIIAATNAKHESVVIRRASEAMTSHSLRRPTGIPDLDIALAGGFPEGALSVITGPDGAGKDYILNCLIRELQKNYGENMQVAIFSTEFPYDKDFAREKCGVRVADTDEEIAEKQLSRLQRGQPPLTDEEITELQTQVGNIYLIQGLIVDHGLDLVLECLSTGMFQMIAINSLGVFETQAKEDTESVSEHAIQSSEAQLLSRFIPKMFMLLNRTTELGGRNETTLIATNQVRANRDQVRMKPGVPVPQHMKYQPGSGSRALAHGKAIDLMLHKGPTIVDKADDPPTQIGRTINWELTKGKLGTHDGLKGSYEFYYDFGADIPSSLLSAGVRFGIIEQAGAWYSYEDENAELSFHVQGANAARTPLTKPDVSAAIYQKVIAAAKISCRFV